MSQNSDDDADVPKLPDDPNPGKKIFLSHCNSYEGRALFKELWNREQFIGNEYWAHLDDATREAAVHTFTGTVRREERNARGGYEEPPEGINEFVEFERTAEFRTKLLQSDVVIYDLMSNSFEEVDYVIKTLKTSDY